MIYLAAVLMTLVGALGAYFYKIASAGEPGLLPLLRRPSFWVGTLVYLTSSVLNIWLLRRLDYTVLYPMTAITYVWSLLLGRLFLGERITPRKLAGVAVLLLGVFLLTR